MKKEDKIPIWFDYDAYLFLDDFRRNPWRAKQRIDSDPDYYKKLAEQKRTRVNLTELDTSKDKQQE